MSNAQVAAELARLRGASDLRLREYDRASDAPIVERDPDRLVFRSRNFCPTLEACRILDLDTRRVCRLYNEGATGELLRLVDPRLVFRRNYEKLRPYAAFCEEIIELGARTGCRSHPRNAP